jgi:16S rRNA (uracil1498-N3)-methyltransferase
MARRRFFVPQVRRGTAELTGSDAEHLVRVLRAEVGQVYEISDNERLYLAEITTARKSEVVFEVRDELPVPRPPVRLILLAALIKFERFEWLIEKATELGAAEIRPFLAARTDPGLDKAASKRLARWEKIALEASQQSRRTRLPEIFEPIRLPIALETQADVRLLLDEDPAAPPILHQLPAERTVGNSVALLLGPEGGWTDEERKAASAAGWLPASFGQTVLRTETAAAAGLSVIQAAWAQNRNAPASDPREAS